MITICTTCGGKLEKEKIEDFKKPHNCVNCRLDLARIRDKRSKEKRHKAVSVNNSIGSTTHVPVGRQVIR